MDLRALTIPALLYTLLGMAANPAAAGDTAARIAALRDGDMRKLVVHAQAEPAPEVSFTGPDGAPTTLGASNGKVRVVNFWATWCAPCREEMPALEALHESFGGADFEVILIATGRNGPEAIARFFEEEEIDALETGLDPKGELAQAMGVPGLPVTVILDRDGGEVARLLGGADWNDESARAIVGAMIGR